MTLSGYGYTTKVGHPCLPVIREFLEIPYGADVSVRLLDSVYREYSLLDLGVEDKLIPAQAPVPKIRGALESAPFVFDKELYSSDEYCLEHELLFRDQGFVRGFRAGFLEIFPVNYNPAASSIKVLTSARVEILFRGSDPALTEKMMSRYSTPAFDRLASGIFLNHVSSGQGTLGAGACGTRSTGYLIIAHQTFVNNADLQEFVDHKSALGFDVTLVDSGTAGGSKDNIRSYIQDAVRNWPVPPEYVLLVGDTQHIDCFTGIGGSSAATDLNFAMVSPFDYFPDVFIGRFSVTSNTHLSNLVQKILVMESTSHKSAVFMASEDNYWISEGTHNYVINNFLNGNGWSSDKLYCHTYNAQTWQVRNSFNSGRSLGIYSGHGSTTYWADGPHFDKGDVQGLTNSIYPVVMSFACYTGDYDYSECFAETWTREQRGAALFWGSSVTSYWDEDDVLEKKVVEGWYGNGLERFGEMGDYGKYELYQYLGGSSTARRYYEMYNVLGDPSMKVLGEVLGGSFTNFGTGIPSPTYGQPTITGKGDLTPGGLGIELTMASVRPSDNGLFFYGDTHSGGVPCMGGYLYPFPFLGMVSIAVGADGTLDVQCEIPSGYPHDVHLFLQTFFEDDTGPAGVTSTDCLDMWIY